MRHGREKESGEPLFDLNTSVQEALAEVPVALAVFDPGLRFRWLSAAFASLSGIHTSEHIGKHIGEIAPHLASALEPPLRMALEEGEATASFDLRLEPQQSASNWKVHARALRYEGGQVRAVVAAVLEETQQRSLELQFLQAQKMEVVGRLAASMAHDFNNLLTAVSAFAQFALEGTPEGSPVRDDLEQIVHAIERGTAVTRRLLALARTHAATAQPIDLNRLFSDLRGLLERLLGEDVHLQLELEPKLWLVDADPGLIEQVVLNLAINARDAMPSGGLLRITTANRELDSAFSTSHPEVTPGPFVVFTLSDNGVGMDAETLAHLFEPFFTTKPVGRGTGLGLATVRSIVRQFGGTVTIDSEPAVGTTCTVYLPRSVTPLPEIALEPSSEALSARVLVVEDDDAVRAAIRRVLERAGCTVFEAAHGIQGLAMLMELDPPPDLVVTDLVMPEMGGFEFWREATAQFPGLRVLLMSGYAAEATRVRALAEQGAMFLEKPFAGAALLAKVRAILARDSASGNPSLH